MTSLPPESRPAGPSPPTGALLQVEALSFGPAGRALAEPLSFTLAPGCCLVLLGPNGAGKTSLMRTLIGALAPLAGNIRWAGRLLASLSDRQRARRVAFAASRPADESGFTVEHLAMLGRVNARGLLAGPTAADRQRVDQVLAQLGLGRLRSRALAELSDGERHLASIARALSQDAQALVLDEPVASLDPARQSSLLATIGGLAAGGQAIILSTHDPNHALALADQVLLWQPDGHIAWGSAARLLQPGPLSAAYGVEVKLHHAEDGSTVFGFGALRRR